MAKERSPEWVEENQELILAQTRLVGKLKEED